MPISKELGDRSLVPNSGIRMLTNSRDPLCRHSLSRSSSTALWTVKQMLTKCIWLIWHLHPQYTTPSIFEASMLKHAGSPRACSALFLVARSSGSVSADQGRRYSKCGIRFRARNHALLKRATWPCTESEAHLNGLDIMHNMILQSIRCVCGRYSITHASFSLSLYIYIYIHTHTSLSCLSLSLSLSLSIYICRERERDIYIHMTCMYLCRGRVQPDANPTFSATSAPARPAWHGGNNNNNSKT